MLFSGINPSLYSAAVGHHFARPGNRFWPALFRAGFTNELLSPFDDDELLEAGLGITNLVCRATARADELSAGELRRGAATLARKVARRKPAVVAVLGVTAYRRAFGVPSAQIGAQERTIGGAAVWILPNPSGLNAHYQLDDLAREFRALYRAVEAAR